MNALPRRERKRASLALLIVCCAAIASSGCAKDQLVISTPELCRDWIVQTKSKDDRLTEGTASNMEASNKSREVWGCHPTRNEAKS